jgi:hypothetical protein
MNFRGAFALATLLALTACAGVRAPAERQTTTSPPPARTAPAVTRQASRLPAAAPAQKLLISDLIGRETAQIDAQIGSPDLIRTEGDGEVRIYRNPACILHVFAYPRAGVHQATHIEARTPGGQIVGEDADECLTSFARS